MNKLILATIITVVTVVLVLAIFFQSEFSNSQTNMETPAPTTKPITNVHLSNFQFTRFFAAEGLSWHAGFVIEITNNETVRVDDLTLTFVSESPYDMNRTVGFYNNVGPYSQRYVVMGQPCFLDSLEQGETMVLSDYIINNMGDSYRIRGYDFVVTLRIGDTVLDQATTMIPGPTYPPP